MHCLIADELEARDQHNSPAEIEAIARHLAEAGEYSRAIEYWQTAGQLASASSSNAESVAFFLSALEALAHLPDSPERAAREAGLQLAICGPYIGRLGYGSDEVKQALSRAWELLSDMQAHPEKVSVMFHLSSHHMAIGEHRKSRELAEQAHSLLTDCGDRQMLASASFGRGVTAFFGGELHLADSHLSTARELYELRPKEELIPFYGQDYGVLMRSYGAFVKCLFGDTDAGEQLNIEALSLAHERNHTFTQALAYVFDGWVQLLQEDVAAVESSAKRLLEHAEKHDLALPLSTARHFLAWCALKDGHPCRAIQSLHQVREMWRAIGVRFYSSALQAWLAEAHLRVGDLTEARLAVDEALKYSDESNELFYRPELHRVKGDILVAECGDEREARREFGVACEWAVKQDALIWLKRYPGLEKYLPRA